MTIKTLSIAALATLAVSGAALADTLYVDVTNAGDPLEDGTQIHPFDSIQEAIDVAFDFDEVLVAPGVYQEAIDYGGRLITVCGEQGAQQTVIDASGIPNTAVVTFDNMESVFAVLKGFTITGGTGLDDGFNQSGGGIRNVFSSPTIRDCIIEGNTADQGAGIYNFLSNPSFANCVFINNTATIGGAFFNEFSSNPFLEQCTIAANVAAVGAGFYLDSSSARLINCIVWGNTDDSFASANAKVPEQAVVTYSDVEACPVCLLQEGNFEADPDFVDLASQDVHLMPSSPCIDAGDSTAVAEDIFEDLDGAPRGVDDPNTVDTGVPIFGLTVDLGVYERQVDSPCGQCQGDVNGDGLVNVLDLLVLLGMWGSCP